MIALGTADDGKYVPPRSSVSTASISKFAAALLMSPLNPAARNPCVICGSPAYSENSRSGNCGAVL